MSQPTKLTGEALAELNAAKDFIASGYEILLRSDIATSDQSTFKVGEGLILLAQFIRQKS